MTVQEEKLKEANMNREIELKSRVKSPVFWIGLAAASKLKRQKYGRRRN